MQRELSARDDKVLLSAMHVGVTSFCILDVILSDLRMLHDALFHCQFCSSSSPTLFSQFWQTPSDARSRSRVRRPTRETPSGRLGKSRADSRAPKGERAGSERRRPVSERTRSRNPRVLSDRQPHTSDRHGRGQHEVGRRWSSLCAVQRRSRSPPAGLRRATVKPHCTIVA